jgi:hypothetical protein
MIGLVLSEGIQIVPQITTLDSFMRYSCVVLCLVTLNNPLSQKIVTDQLAKIIEMVAWFAVNIICYLFSFIANISNGIKSLLENKLIRGFLYVLYTALYFYFSGVIRNMYRIVCSIITRIIGYGFGALIEHLFKEISDVLTTNIQTFSTYLFKVFSDYINSTTKAVYEALVQDVLNRIGVMYIKDFFSSWGDKWIRFFFGSKEDAPSLVDSGKFTEAFNIDPATQTDIEAVKAWLSNTDPETGEIVLHIDKARSVIEHAGHQMALKTTEDLHAVKNRFIDTLIDSTPKNIPPLDEFYQYALDKFNRSRSSTEMIQDFYTYYIGVIPKEMQLAIIAIQVFLCILVAYIFS